MSLAAPTAITAEPSLLRGTRQFPDTALLDFVVVLEHVQVGGDRRGSFQHIVDQGGDAYGEHAAYVLLRQLPQGGGFARRLSKRAEWWRSLATSRASGRQIRL